MLTPTLRRELFPYLAEVCRNTGCECFQVGGFDDHVHLAARLSKTMAMADLIETLKTSSSKWIKTKSPSFQKFAWQTGYGAFSVSPRGLPSLLEYIRNQDEHHKTVTFEEEYRKFLVFHGVEYKEEYLWG